MKTIHPHLARKDYGYATIYYQPITSPLRGHDHRLLPQHERHYRAAMRVAA